MKANGLKIIICLREQLTIEPTIIKSIFMAIKIAISNTLSRVFKKEKKCLIKYFHVCI